MVSVDPAGGRPIGAARGPRALSFGNPPATESLYVDQIDAQQVVSVVLPRRPGVDLRERRGARLALVSGITVTAELGAIMWKFENPIDLPGYEIAAFGPQKSTVTFVKDGDTYAFDNPQRDYPDGQQNTLLCEGHGFFDAPDHDLHVTLNSGAHAGGRQLARRHLPVRGDEPRLAGQGSRLQERLLPARGPAGQRRQGHGRITIDPNGNVGINETDPEATLEVGGAAQFNKLRCNELLSTVSNDLVMKRGIQDEDLADPYNATWLSTKCVATELRIEMSQEKSNPGTATSGCSSSPARPTSTRPTPAPGPTSCSSPTATPARSAPPTAPST